MISLAITSYSLTGTALTGGVLDLWGEDYGPTWTRLAVTAARGATQITLNETVGWQVGHEIGNDRTEPI